MIQQISKRLKWWLTVRASAGLSLLESESELATCMPSKCTAMVTHNSYILVYFFRGKDICSTVQPDCDTMLLLQLQMLTQNAIGDPLFNNSDSSDHDQRIWALKNAISDS